MPALEHSVFRERLSTTPDAHRREDRRRPRRRTLRAKQRSTAVQVRCCTSERVGKHQQPMPARTHAMACGSSIEQPREQQRECACIRTRWQGKLLCFFSNFLLPLFCKLKSFGGGGFSGFGPRSAPPHHCTPPTPQLTLYGTTLTTGCQVCGQYILIAFAGPQGQRGLSLLFCLEPALRINRPGRCRQLPNRDCLPYTQLTRQALARDLDTAVVKQRADCLLVLPTAWRTIPDTCVGSKLRSPSRPACRSCAPPTQKNDTRRPARRRRTQAQQNALSCGSSQPAVGE
jgi:hypothetical protein